MTAAIPLVVNARAGPGSAPSVVDRLPEMFRAAGLEAEVLRVGDGADIPEMVRNALRGRPQCIVAGGGDGTINAVAGALAGSPVALGVLPLGTLNHFARDLGIPTEVEGAVRVIAAGRTVPIDVGDVNGHLFLNNSSLGLYPRMVHDRDRQQQRLGRNKWAALLRSSLALLHRYPLLDVRVRVDDRDLVRRTPLVFVGNNAYAMEGLHIGTRERIDGGMLSLYIPHCPGRLALFGIAFRALFGRLRVSDFDSMTAPDIVIETRRAAVRVATDGEVTGMATPLRYRIRPGALRVIVPREAEGERAP